MVELSVLSVEVKATELPIVQEIIQELRSAKDSVAYYEGLLDYLHDVIPCLDDVVASYNEGLEGQ